MNIQLLKNQLLSSHSENIKALEYEVQIIQARQLKYKSNFNTVINKLQEVEAALNTLGLQVVKASNIVRQKEPKLFIEATGGSYVFLDTMDINQKVHRTLKQMAEELEEDLEELIEYCSVMVVPNSLRIYEGVSLANITITFP